MIRGLYTSAAGMLALTRRMEVATNNMANAQTTGFKRELTAEASFAEQLLLQQSDQQDATQVGPVSLSTLPEEPRLDLTQGSLQTTGRDLDFSLTGAGLFVVQAPEGVRYTRDGTFTKDVEGRLVTTGGALVLGENGPLQPPDGKLTVGLDGTLAVDGAPFGRFQLADFGPDAALKKLGNNLLVPRDETQQPRRPAGTSVVQGALEASNVDLGTEMTAAIELQRAYEANQRMIQNQDELTGRAVSDIARPA